MRVRPVLLRLHRWAGLTAGAVITVVCLSGALLVFGPEMDRALRPDLWTAGPEPGPPLPPSALIEAIHARHPRAGIVALELSSDPGRSALVELRGGTQAFLHPRSGTVLGERAVSESFVGRVETLHTTLLAGRIGRTLVGASTAFLLVLVSLGLWLWWPGRGARLRDGFTAHLRRGWKRAVYDLHNVLGFYASVGLLLLAGTGTVLAYPALRTAAARFVAVIDRRAGQAPGRETVRAATGHEGLAIHRGTRATGVGAPSRRRPAMPALRLASAQHFGPAVDRALERAAAEFPDARSWRIALPSRPRGRLRITVSRKSAPHPGATERLLFDGETGRLVRVERYAKATRAGRLNRLVGPIHVGDVLGLPTRLLALFASLVGATLPLTGTIVWFPRWRRRRRARRRRRGSLRRIS